MKRRRALPHWSFVLRFNGAGHAAKLPLDMGAILSGGLHLHRPDNPTVVPGRVNVDGIFDPRERHVQFEVHVPRRSGRLDGRGFAGVTGHRGATNHQGGPRRHAQPSMTVHVRHLVRMHPPTRLNSRINLGTINSSSSGKNR